MALSSPVHICAENYDFDKDILPILERVCIDCHGPEKQKGDLRLDQLNPNFLKGGDVDSWHDALDQINLGEMPPEKAKKS